MSYMQFQQRCEDCKKEWNAAFGIVGTTILASPPVKCPHCKSEKISRIAEGWKITKENEKEFAIRLANKILDRPSGDPDDDLATLSRQFLRALELRTPKCPKCGSKKLRCENGCTWEIENVS